MTRPLIVSTALTLAGLGTWAYAHPLKEVESLLRNDEPNVQFMHVEAPAFHLANSTGRPVSLEDFRGNVVVLNFVDARCKGACPKHMALIAKLQSMVEAAAMRDQVRFATIATDEGDVQTTRARMVEQADAYGIDTRNWVFLYRRQTQPPATTRRLGQAYGLKPTPAGKGAQMHSVVTYVIDQTGQQRARFHGLEVEPISLLLYVNALVNDDHSQQ